MKHPVRILGSEKVIDLRTEEGQDFWSLAIETAKATGRVIFGQLWVPEDPTVDDILYVQFAPAIIAALNKPSIVLEALGV